MDWTLFTNLMLIGKQRFYCLFVMLSVSCRYFMGEICPLLYFSLHTVNFLPKKAYLLLGLTTRDGSGGCFLHEFLLLPCH